MAQYFWTPDPGDLGGAPTGWAVYWEGLDNFEVKQDGAGDYYLEIALDEQSRALAAFETFDGESLTSITDADLFSEVEFDNAESEASMASRADNSGTTSDDAHGYRIGLENNTVQINAYVSGSSNGYASESAGYTSGQRVRQRSRVVSTSQKVRWWDAANAEPSTWDLETTNSDITTAGAVGFMGWTSDANPNVVRVYSFGIGTNGDSAPTEPVSGGNTITQTLASITQDASGDLLFSITASQTLSSVTQSLSASSIFNATVTQTLGAVNQDAQEAPPEPTGDITQTLGAITQSAEAQYAFSGTATQTLPSITQIARESEQTSATAGVNELIYQKRGSFARGSLRRK